jgi:hypothetical protein
MIVTKKIHMGEKKYKMQLHYGHLYSSLGKQHLVQMGRDIGHHVVVMDICLRESILCSHCESGHDVDVELVMN